MKLSAQLCYRISVFGALVLLALTMLARLGSPPAGTCSLLAEGYEPIVAFELVRSVSDLQVIFGQPDDACRAGITASLDQTNVIDATIFIPAYTLFLAFVLLGLRAGSGAATLAHRLAGLGAAIAMTPALADYVENAALFQLSAAPDVVSVWIPVLIGATNFKWVGLGLVTALGGVVLWTGGGLARSAIGPCSLALVVGVVALVAPGVAGPWLLEAMTVAWLPLLVVALAGAFGKRAT
jgi:hypothetical protein